MVSGGKVLRDPTQEDPRTVCETEGMEKGPKVTRESSPSLPFPREVDPTGSFRKSAGVDEDVSHRYDHKIITTHITSVVREGKGERGDWDLYPWRWENPRNRSSKTKSRVESKREETSSSSLSRLFT